MGTTRMKCKECGTENINNFVIWFKGIPDGHKSVYMGATTLPKFLYELKYPEQKKITGAVMSLLITKEKLSPIKIYKITCDKCLTEGRGEVIVTPTRYGI